MKKTSARRHGPAPEDQPTKPASRLRVVNQALAVGSLLLVVLGYQAIQGNLPAWRSKEHERFLAFFEAVSPKVHDKVSDEFAGRGTEDSKRSTNLAPRMSGQQASIYANHLVDGKVVFDARLDYRYTWGAWWFSSGVVAVDGEQMTLDEGALKASVLADLANSSKF